MSMCASGAPSTYGGAVGAVTGPVDARRRASVKLSATAGTNTTGAASVGILDALFFRICVTKQKMSSGMFGCMHYEAWIICNPPPTAVHTHATADDADDDQEDNHNRDDDRDD